MPSSQTKRLARVGGKQYAVGPRVQAPGAPGFVMTVSYWRTVETQPKDKP
jgi:hypothetical protein